MIKIEKGEVGMRVNRVNDTLSVYKETSDEDTTRARTGDSPPDQEIGKSMFASGCEG